MMSIEGPERVSAPAIEQPADDQEDGLVFNDVSDFGDEDEDGAASIAGRLRPAIPRA
jgi:hypothetical protein